ncbi:MAG TPA: A/G-specific adenine glycosylase [Bacteroidales bacterium]
MNNFGNDLIAWYKQNKRPLPWRESSDPYKIWLSEIILQQTRVQQGTAYYHRFVEEFPDVHSLAKAPTDKIFKMWQGLGYYNRAANLIQAAKKISTEYEGKFPESPEELMKIKGIGSYTAAAIASLAFNVSVPVVDGNVFRLLSRIFGIETPVNSSSAKKEFEKIAQSLMLNHPPGEFNQAMMEFGALYCKPKQPDCSNCIFIQNCFAGKKRQVEKFPVKNPKAAVKKIYLFYFLIEVETDETSKIWIKKRTETDIWKNLYDFPHAEYDEPVQPEIALIDFMKNVKNADFVLKNISSQYKHQLTHRQIHATFLRLVVNKKFDFPNKNSLILIKLDDLDNYPVSRLIDRYIKEQKIIK